LTTKAEQKRAEIIAKQAARELAEGGSRPATGADAGGAGGGTKRRKFTRPPFAGRSPGRPPNKMND
jgi:hypothetical protein